MNHRRTSLFVLLILIAACGGKEPITPEVTVASVTVSPANPSVEIGGTQQMSAVATSTTGGSVSGLTVQWSSSDNTVATITPAGLVTGLTEGTSAITATVGGKAGSQVMTVVPDECAQAITVVLDPGQHQTYSASECLLFPSGASGDYYRIAITRPSEISNPSDVADATLRATGISTLQSLRAPTSAPAAVHANVLEDLGVLDGARFLENRALKARTAQFHMSLLENEIRERGPGPDGVLPNRKPSGLRLMADPPSRLSINSELSCSGTFTPATLVNFNDDIAIYQDSTERSTRPLSTTATQEMLDYYTSYAKQMISDYWGTVTDLDSNGRIVVTTAPSLGDSIAASVFTGDLRTNGSCAASNLGEVIFFNADLILAMDEASQDWLALSTLAHEIKHLISIYHRFAAGTGIPPLWIEEGTAEISASMSSRVAWAATGGPPVGSPVTGNNLRATLCKTDPCAFTKEIYGVVDDIANTIVTLSTHPNSLVVNPDGANQFHSIYASGWHFHRFIADAFGNAATPFADGALFKQLVDSTTAFGTAGLAQVTGRSFGQLLEDLIVAMSLHNTPAPAPTRAFTTYDWLTAASIFSAPADLAPPGIYPWPVTVDTTSEQLWAPFASNTYTGNIGPSGMRFHDFQSDGSGTDLQVEITVGGTSSSVIVTRIR